MEDNQPIARRIFRLKTAVSTGLLGGFLLSPKLWLSSRMYPLTPVARFLRPIPPPFDYAVFAVLLLLLAWIAVRASPAKEIAAFVALAALYGLCDQSRWQPWCQPSAISEDHVKIYPVTARIGAEEDSALGVGEIAMNGQGVEVVGQVIA